MENTKETTKRLIDLQHEERELWLSYAQKLEQIGAKRRALLSEQMSHYSQNTHSTSHASLVPHSEGQAQIATADGRKLSHEEQSGIKDDDYDVILNLRSRRLKYRKAPEEFSPLMESDSTLPGPHRMRILAYMLEHPGRPFHAGNIYAAYSLTPEVKDKSTFTKTIGVLRRALGQTDTAGPYIVIEPDSDGITGRKRGFIYRVNEDWRYLVIRET